LFFGTAFFFFFFLFQNLKFFFHFFLFSQNKNNLTTETIKSAALALERVDDIQSRDGLPASVLAVSHTVTDDRLKEHLEDTTGLIIDEPRDTLDTPTTSETTNRRLGDTLDGITKHLAMPLGTTLSKTLATLSASRHFF
jgi:hypothetical protein